MGGIAARFKFVDSLGYSLGSCTMIEQNTKVWIGVDPGKTGAIGIVDKLGNAEVYDYPEDVDNCAAMMGMIVARLDIVGGMIEKVSAMPGQGVTGMFNFGGNYFGWRMALACFHVPYELVTPAKWQKAMLDSGGGTTKERSLNMARRIFPGLELHFKKHDGRADALHLARYALSRGVRGFNG